MLSHLCFLSSCDQSQLSSFAALCHRSCSTASGSVCTRVHTSMGGMLIKSIAGVYIFTVIEVLPSKSKQIFPLELIKSPAAYKWTLNSNTVVDFH